MTISFDGPNKLAILSSGTTTLNVKDFWSRWVDWWVTGDNSKWPLALAQVGGNEIDPIEGTAIPPYIYCLNGWRIRPQEASHTLSVTGGTLLVEGGGDPFVNTIGSYNVRIRYSQPVQAITVNTGGGSSSDPWSADLSGYTSGTAGHYIYTKILTVAKFLGLK